MVHREWIHMCWLNNGTTSRAYINGNLSMEYLSPSPFENVTLDKPGNYSMIFGQEADSFKSNFDPKQSMRGKISEFQIWNYTLSSKSINDLSKCKSELQGNMVSWDKEYITFHNVHPEFLNIETLCAPYEKVIFINDPMNYKDADDYCRIHAGFLYTPESKLRNDWMLGMAHKFNKTCGDEVWINKSLSLNKMKSESKIYFNNWERNLIEDTCGVVRPNGKWMSESSIKCDFQNKCFACAFVHEPVFTLKGFCLNFIPSYNFYINHGENGMEYIGYRDSTITRSENRWKLLDEKGIEVIKSPEDKKTPLGRMTWFGTYENCKLIKNNILISFSTCNMQHQFTCSSGQCIDIDKYCNNILDCNDGSDENECKNIVTDQRYSINTPPDAENMFISVEVIQFDHIDSLKMTMTLTMDIQISWKDPRLVFTGLPRFHGKGTKFNEFGLHRSTTYCWFKFETSC